VSQVCSCLLLEKSRSFVEVTHGDRSGAAGKDGFEGGQPGGCPTEAVAADSVTTN